MENGNSLAFSMQLWAASHTGPASCLLIGAVYLDVRSPFQECSDIICWEVWKIVQNSPSICAHVSTEQSLCSFPRMHHTGLNPILRASFLSRRLPSLQHPPPEPGSQLGSFSLWLQPAPGWGCRICMKEQIIGKDELGRKFQGAGLQGEWNNKGLKNAVWCRLNR